MGLRPYQRDCLKASLTDYRAGIRRQLWVMPTASGKTKTAACVPTLFSQKPGEKTLFVAPMDDLVWQAQRAHQKTNPDMKVGIEKAGNRADADCDIIVGSIQSLAAGGGTGSLARLDRLGESSIKSIVLDEAHHSVAQSFATVLRHLRALKGDDNCDHTKAVIGLTGTPNRMDGLGLEAIFDKISFEISMRTLMETGLTIQGRLYPYLTTPISYRVNTDVDVSSRLRSRGGDFIEKDLAGLLDTPTRNRMIVDYYLQLGRNEPGMCPTINVAHAVHMVEAFAERGVAAAVVSGKTSRTERDALYAATAEGRNKVLCSAATLSEGWDLPAATVCLLARPTRSGLLYRQTVGRVLRPSPAPEDYEEILAKGERPPWIKENAIIIDFCDIVGTHELQTMSSLFGLHPDFDMQGKDALKVVTEVEALVKKQAALDLRACATIEDVRSQAERIDLWRAPVVRPDVRRLSSYLWLEVFEGVLQLNLSKGMLEIRQNTLGHYEIYRSRSGMRAKMDSKPTLKAALECADALVPQSEAIILKSKVKWRSHPPTEKQCAALFRLDTRIKNQFRAPSDFFAWATKQHWNRDQTFSKGGISSMIDRIRLSQGGKA
jgi:superfamily II DNA or RNA helicase